MEELRSPLSASPEATDGYQPGGLRSRFMGPFDYLRSPSGRSSVPFSWEQRRGIPKTPCASKSRPSSSFSASVPFSWEQHPGVPKTPGTSKSRPSSSSSSSSVPISWKQGPGIPKAPPNPAPPISSLPLPPPLRSSTSDSFRKKRFDARPDAAAAAAADPFAAALAECAKESRPAETEELRRRGEKATVRQRKAAVWSISDRFGIFGLVGSCKSGRSSVADSTVCVPRSSLRTAR